MAGREGATDVREHALETVFQLHVCVLVICPPPLIFILSPIGGKCSFFNPLLVTVRAASGRNSRLLCELVTALRHRFVHCVN